MRRGVLVPEGAGRAAAYAPAPAGSPSPRALLEQDAPPHVYATAGLAEDRVWDDLVARTPLLADLTGDAESVFHYACTELVNNAIDHSGSPTVTVSVERAGPHVALTVVDDGIGVFANVRAGRGLDDELHAVQLLSKGKTTTMPDRHSGEGLFFTSKAADLFVLESGRTRWLVDNLRGDHAIERVDPPRQGTLARFEVDPARPRNLRRLFDEYTTDFEFVRTRAVVRLFEYGHRFVSRSEAKRFLEGLERFQEVVVDFAGVTAVGQGFADEVFRVWARAHPETALVPVHMVDEVAFFVRRALAAR